MWGVRETKGGERTVLLKAVQHQSQIQEHLASKLSQPLVITNNEPK